MTNSFDAKLPKTIQYWTEDKIFFMKNTNFMISEEEGHALAELLIYAMKDPSTKGIVIDNREAKGAWPENIHRIWETDSRYTDLVGTKKMATLTSTAITSMQLNRLSKEFGMEKISKGFNSEFTDEIKAFILG